jgi:hypothetical protein
MDSGHVSTVCCYYTSARHPSCSFVRALIKLRSCAALALATDAASIGTGTVGGASRVSTDGGPLFTASDCQVRAARAVGSMGCCCWAGPGEEVGCEVAPNADADVVCVVWKMADGSFDKVIDPSEGWMGMEPATMPDSRSVLLKSWWTDCDSLTRRGACVQSGPG